ncbi:MAG TPA: TetR/AcrR family transcriptional regulator [Streptosporangiaceae bacterium]
MTTSADPGTTGPGTRSRARRAGYHHGDLANALADAATEMASQGGPEAVVLREAARRTGVSAAAAYRHFADHGELLGAVKVRAGESLAAAMEAGLRRGEPLAEPRAEAVRKLGALGRAYLDFAMADPGLFRTAFCRPSSSSADLAERVASSPPYQMLAGVLDELTECGVLAPDRRPLAEVAVWSSVHGLATLLLDGPLAHLTDQEQEMAVNRTFSVLMDGIAAPPR